MKALNLSSLMVGAGCSIAGTASAELLGNIEYLQATMCLLFTIFAQLSANFYRRYTMVRTEQGERLGWKLPTHPKTFETNLLRSCALASLFLAVLIGSSLITVGGWWAAAVGVFLVVCGWLWAGGPHPWCRTAFSPWASLVLFGPVCVIFTCMLQLTHDSPRLTWFFVEPSVYAGLAMGVMAFNATLAYNIVTCEEDRETGRKSFVTVFGTKTTQATFLVNSIIVAVIMTCANLKVNLERPWHGIVGAAVVLLFDLYIVAEMPKWREKRKGWLTDMANFAVLLMGLILYLVANLSEYDDNSVMNYF